MYSSNKSGRRFWSNWLVLHYAFPFRSNPIAVSPPDPEFALLSLSPLSHFTDARVSHTKIAFSVARYGFGVVRQKVKKQRI